MGAARRGGGAKLMGMADLHGPPIAVHAASAAPHEVTLVGGTLERGLTPARPRRPIGDRAYGGGALDARLAGLGVELLAPHRSNRVKAATQDGRPPRRYRRRRRVGRLWSWLFSYRRVAARFDYHVENFPGFVHLGCIKMLLRCYL